MLKRWFMGRGFVCLGAQQDFPWTPTVGQLTANRKAANCKLSTGQQKVDEQQ